MDISTVTRSTSLWLAFPASVQQRKLRKHSHVVLNSPVTTTGNITEAPELGAPHYKAPNDVRYRGFHCRSHANHLTTLVTLCACDSSPSPQYSPTQGVTLHNISGDFLGRCGLLIAHVHFIINRSHECTLTFTNERHATNSRSHACLIPRPVLMVWE